MPTNDFLSPEETINSDKQLMESPEVEAIAKKVIEQHKMEFGPAEIGYFLVYPNISRQKAAKCMKASREVRCSTTRSGGICLRVNWRQRESTVGGSFCGSVVASKNLT